MPSCCAGLGEYKASLALIACSAACYILPGALGLVILDLWPAEPQRHREAVE